MLTVLSMIVTSVLTLSGLASAGQNTLYDLVRQANPRTAELSVTIKCEMLTPNWRQLVTGSDLVVEGIIDRTISRLTADARSVQTVSDVLVQRVMRSKMPVPSDAIQRLRVIQVGGDVDIDDTLVKVRDSCLPPFVAARQFILFLKQYPNEPEGTFYVLYGPYGTFDLRGGQVYSFRQGQHTFLLREGGQLGIREFDGVEIDRFAAAVEAVHQK